MVSKYAPPPARIMIKPCKGVYATEDIPKDKYFVIPASNKITYLTPRAIRVTINQRAPNGQSWCTLVAKIALSCG